MIAGLFTKPAGPNQRAFDLRESLSTWTTRRNLDYRIQFLTEQDRIKGNYLLATNSVVRRLAGHIFEINEADCKFLDEHQLHYTILSIPDPSGSDQEVRNPLTVEL